MELTRRTALGASLAIAATPLLPRAAYASAVPIEWHPGALGHKFEPLAGSWCVQRIRFAVQFDATVDLAYSVGETSSDDWNDRYVTSAFPYPLAESGYAIERITC